MKTTTLKQALAKLQADIDAATEAKTILLRDYTAEHCPLKVGDLLEVPKEAWSSVGKACCVTRVFTRTDYFDGLEFRVKADVLRKDGSKGVRSVSWTIPAEA